MKTKQLLFLFLFVGAAIFMTSCSSSSDDGGDSSGATSITISSNPSSLELGGAFTFTVKDNSNTDVTSQSTIIFNGTAISGATYSPTEGGTYNVNAKYGALTSNSISVTVTVAAVLSSISVNTDKTMVLKGQSVTLTAIGNEGTDLTPLATFYVDGVAITGNIYMSDTFGNKIITATYETFNSNEKALLVGHTKNVLIEDFTGAWCGFCPRVAYGIDQVKAQTDKAVVVAIHRGTASGNNYDPYNYPASALEDFVGLEGYPWAQLNRRTTWIYPEPSNVNQVINLTNGVSSKGLGLNSTLSGNSLNISVKMSVLDNSATNLKLVVYILENGLILNQVNYTNYYGGASVIQNFEHNNVLRQVPTDIFGDALNAGEIESGSGNYIKNFNVTLTSNIANTNNLSLAVFLVDANGNAVNSKSALVGETKDFN